MRDDDLIRFLAAWLLVHEVADEGLKAAVRRGEAAESGGMGASGAASGPDAFVDGLAAMVDERKEELKRHLAEGGGSAAEELDIAGLLEEVRFELGEIRGRLDSLETAVDALGRGGGGSRTEGD